MFQVYSVFSYYKMNSVHLCFRYTQHELFVCDYNTNKAYANAYAFNIIQIVKS